MRILLAVVFTPITLLLDLALLWEMASFFGLTRGLWSWVKREKGRTLIQSLSALGKKVIENNVVDPPFAHAPRRYILIAMAISAIAAFGFVQVSSAWGLSSALWWLLLITTFVISTTLVDEFVQWFHKRHVARYVQESDFTACLNCGYALRGLPKQHTCPECGRAYELENVWKTWLTWLDQK